MAVGLYDRQSTLQLRVPKNMTIVGVGGIGSWVAIDAAMSGVQNLYLFDPDNLEEHNRNRLPFCQSSINRPKVDVVTDFIRAIRPEAVVVPIKERLEGLLLQIQLSVSEWIVDCTDSPKSQFTIYNACKQNNVQYLRVGYDGTSMTVTGHVSGWIKNTEDVEHYAINPSWVVPAQVVAALAVGRIMKYTGQEVACDVGDIGIAVLQKTEQLTPRCRQSGRDVQFRDRLGNTTGRTRYGR